jgi:Ca-activated chloride channel homolog
MLSVTVTDRGGNFVMGLPAESFNLIDGKAIPATHVNDPDEPLSVGILIDTSSSMQDPEVQGVARPEPLKQAVARFLEVSNPKNEYFVMTFDKDPQLLLDWRQGKLPDAEIAPPRDKHLTALYDACAAALAKLKDAHHEKHVIVLFSDGLDSGSKTRYDDLRRQLSRTDVIMYAVDPRAVHYGWTWEAILKDKLSHEGQDVLAELIRITGGFVYFPETRAQLEVAAERIAVELRHQYRIAFRPNVSPADKSHRVKLEVTAPPNAPANFRNLRVRTRREY